ncbi:MAG: cbb3-type cytochrome c oxidase subunit II [Acidobacteria bacterium]|nr:cbb3-type cytochrome c oxidase subunit II [Acidobacteriota bacterium]
MTDTGRALRMSYLVASVAGVAFFALSVALLGVWPARVLDAQTAAMAPEHPLEPTTSERRGRAIYAREGCAYCHTQQIRYLPADMERFGAPTLAWETRRDTPHLWGTRRIGPDLSRVGGARSLDWQYAHLFAPRAIVPASVMPGFPRFFDGAPDRPRQEARDLVAYLDSLGRARELAGPEGEAHARAGCDCPDDEMAQMAFAAALNAHPARAIRTADAPPALPAGPDTARGQVLYGRHCATCHGVTGAGDGPGARGLEPPPAQRAEHEYSTARRSAVLWHGVAGSAMPAWRDYAEADRAALAAAVQALSAVRPEPAVPEHLVPIGARVYTANCAQCHGQRGDGRGSAAAKLTMAPADFTVQRLSLSEALRVLREGVHGSPMAPWTTRLTDAERLAVVHYVRSLYPQARAATEAR